MSVERKPDEIVKRVMTTACQGAGRASIAHRGRHWMRRLADGFRSVYPASDVLCHQTGGERTVIIGSVRKKEMMFDILVAGWDEEAIHSTHGTARYPRLKPAIWAVESEVARGMSEVLFDFNKLLMAAAPNKLLVTMERNDNRRFTEALRVAAEGHALGKTYIAYVPSFHESVTNNRTAATPWLVEGGDVPFEIHPLHAATG